MSNGAIDIDDLQSRGPVNTNPGTGTQRTLSPGTTGTSDPEFFDKVEYVSQAILLVGQFVERAIARHTTEDFLEIIKGIVPGLVIALGAVVAFALTGAGIGAFFGGAGAIPGAIVGAVIGTKIAIWLLTWLGLGFLAYYIKEHIDEAVTYLGGGISLAWNSHASAIKINTAAREIAEGIGVLFSLILQAMLVFLLQKGSKGMAQLRNSRFFKWVPGLEGWLEANFIRLCFRYKIKSGIPVISGGAIGPSRFSAALVFAQTTLRGMMSGQRPKFKSFRELHKYLINNGFKLVKGEKQTMIFGPKDPATGKTMKDAAQAIYTSTDGTVVIKIKTRGYPDGTRSSGTMSVEVTNGGSKWKDALGKISREGQLIGKTRLSRSDVFVLEDGVYTLTMRGRKKFQKGAKHEELSKPQIIDGDPYQDMSADLRMVAPWELIEGGGVTPMNPKAWADKGHIDFKSGLNVEGTWEILNLTPP